MVNRLDRLIRHRAGELDICGTRAARLADPDLQRKRLDLARGVDTRRHGRGVCHEPTALLLPGRYLRIAPRRPMPLVARRDKA